MEDNYDRWKQHEARQAQQLTRLPVCADCDAPIQSEYCYEFNGELICETCLEDLHRKYVEDMIE